MRNALLTFDMMRPRDNGGNRKRLWLMVQSGCTPDVIGSYLGITPYRLRQMLDPKNNPLPYDQVSVRVIDDELMRELAAKAHDLSGLCDA